ncbi:class F sortase [Streptomyces sp. WI04-05B]|uniref:class F sortase n=1 Tax=Streptomyces TaxID=1883 RepID=UPI0029AA9BC5|nr:MULTISPECIES: class F sortase [unclassified Streptomyces]MDX2540349.1 class F sortase [Streptomyces sp. WI04-05B]MDX2585218.1 class F sortase [Streptomyces sp. WI04-05A]
MRRFTDILIAALTVTALCSGAWLVRSGGETHAPPQPSAAQARTRPTHPESSHPESPTPTLPPSPPLRIRIPAIGVDAPLMGLGLTATGSLDVPPAEREDLAGWYEDGTVPGGTGTAIVAGHVDNADGPSVFYRLGALEKGGGIEVERLDGSTARFTVDAVEVYDTENFPDEKVYGAAKRAELRVITCGGRYSRSTGYQGNVVVFAHLTGSRRE